MRKSGLHKQISSIFDGVSVPANTAAPETSEAAEESAASVTPDTESVQPATQNSDASLAKPMDKRDLETKNDRAPVVQVGRPMPTSKPKGVSKPKTKSDLLPKIKKTIFGTDTSLDPRQKKTGILVGILSVVFAVVLFLSLGGVGKTQAIGASNTHSEQATQVSKPKRVAEEWTRPDPLPQNLRNATAPATVRIEPSQTDVVDAAGGLIVKGIVFSENKPSAIINNQIFSEGQTVDGAIIIEITKESVEFEANDQRWKQFVQR
jgi:hypothetical protein